MPRISWLRVVATSVLSALMVGVSWSLTLFSSAGVFLAHFLLPDRSSWVSDEGFVTTAVIDFVLWFAFFWGAQGLWIQFRDRVRERSALKQGIRPLRHAAPAVSAVLCGIPLSFYLLLGRAIVANRRMPDSAVSWIAELTVSLAACAVTIFGLFAIAVRFWPASWLPKNRDDGHLTTLDLH
jgi:hypothetical protein